MRVLSSKPSSLSDRMPNAMQSSPLIACSDFDGVSQPVTVDDSRVILRSQPVTVVQIDVTGSSFRRLREFRRRMLINKRGLELGDDIESENLTSDSVAKSKRRKRHTVIANETLKCDSGNTEWRAATYNSTIKPTLCTDSQTKSSHCTTEKVKGQKKTFVDSGHRSSGWQRSLRSLFKPSSSKTDLWAEGQPSSPGPPVINLTLAPMKRSQSLPKSLRSLLKVGWGSNKSSGVTLSENATINIATNSVNASNCMGNKEASNSLRQLDCSEMNVKQLSRSFSNHLYVGSSLKSFLPDEFSGRPRSLEIQRLPPYLIPVATPIVPISPSSDKSSSVAPYATVTLRKHARGDFEQERPTSSGHWSTSSDDSSFGGRWAELTDGRHSLSSTNSDVLKQRHGRFSAHSLDKDSAVSLSAPCEYACVSCIDEESEEVSTATAVSRASTTVERPPVDGRRSFCSRAFSLQRIDEHSDSSSLVHPHQMVQSAEMDEENKFQTSPPNDTYATTVCKHMYATWPRSPSDMKCGLKPPQTRILKCSNDVKNTTVVNGVHRGMIRPSCTLNFAPAVDIYFTDEQNQVKCSDYYQTPIGQNCSLSATVQLSSDKMSSDKMSSDDSNNQTEPLPDKYKPKITIRTPRCNTSALKQMRESCNDYVNVAAMRSCNDYVNVAMLPTTVVQSKPSSDNITTCDTLSMQSISPKCALPIEVSVSYRTLYHSNPLPSFPLPSYPLSYPSSTQLISQGPVGSRYVENPEKRNLYSSVTINELSKSSVYDSPENWYNTLPRTNKSPKIGYLLKTDDCAIGATSDRLPSRPLYPSLGAMKHSVTFPKSRGVNDISADLDAYGKSWYDGIKTNPPSKPLPQSRSYDIGLTSKTGTESCNSIGYNSSDFLTAKYSLLNGSSSTLTGGDFVKLDPNWRPSSFADESMNNGSSSLSVLQRPSNDLRRPCEDFKRPGEDLKRRCENLIEENDGSLERKQGRYLMTSHRCSRPEPSTKKKKVPTATLR